jgi:hypothetical protein
MKNIFSFYKNILPLIVLIIYSLGYVFLSNYYANFGIDIIYYLSLTDILFVSLGILIMLSIALLVVDISINLITTFLFNLKKLVSKKKEKENYNRYSFHFTGLVIFLIFSMVFYNIIEWDFYYYVILLVYIPLKTFRTGDKLDGDHYMIIGIILTVVLLVAAFLFGHSQANNLKNSRSIWFSKQTEFNYHGEFYTTFENDKLIFFGETSNNIFIYNTQTKKSNVFYKTDLDNLIFYNPEILKKEQKM